MAKRDGMDSVLRWRLMATVFAAALPSALPAVLWAAPAPMTDGELWRITAGQAEAASPTLEDLISAAPGSDPYHDAPDPAAAYENAAAIGGTSAAINANARVTLESGAQAGVRAVSVTNMARGDAAGAANIYDGRGGQAVAIQHNDIIQTAPRQGFVAAAYSGGSRHAAVTRQWSESFHDESRTSRAVTDIFSRQSTTREVTAVTVPGFDPFGDMSYSLQTPSNITFTVPGFGFDGTVGEEPFRFGVAASVGATSFTIPSVDFGTVSFEGDDVVISPGSVTLPALSFGGLTGEVCFFECAGGEAIPSFTVGGQTASLPIPELRFAGANPFKDFELQVGQGIAAAGTGSFHLGGLGASLTAGFGLGIPDISGKIGFTIPGLFDGDPVDIKVDITIPMPDVRIDVTAFDFDGPEITGSMTDSVLCMTIPATGSCGTLSLTKEETVTRVNNVRTEEHFENRHSSAFATSAQTAHIGAADLEEAGAMLLAMSESDVTARHSNAVALSGGAQQGFRVMNGVNAAAAIVGSGLNIGTRMERQPMSGDGLRLGQTNFFLQIRLWRCREECA